MKFYELHSYNCIKKTMVIDCCKINSVDGEYRADHREQSQRICGSKQKLDLSGYFFVQF